MNVFELDSSKLNEILYHMENQTKDSIIIISTGEIIYSTDINEINSSKNYPLPKWGPVDGFRIMNEFVSNLNNPLLKEELKIVLNCGSGVFRKFKNKLKSSPEIERVWYSFKRDEIKSRVINWYNQIREYAGLELYQEDNFDDDQDLLDFDFTITKANLEDYEFIKNCDIQGFSELYSNYPKDVIIDIYNRKREDLINENIFSSDYVFLAKTPAGDSVGFVWATGYSLCDSFSGMDLLQIYVVPEYRGLGIGKILLDKILTIYADDEFNDFTVSCQGKSSWLINYLELEGFTIAFQELSFRR